MVLYKDYNTKVSVCQLKNTVFSVKYNYYGNVGNKFERTSKIE